MQPSDITQFISALQRLESQLNTLTAASASLPQPADYQARAELATYVRELNLSAGQWHAQSESLLQLLSDHPALLDSITPAPQEPAYGRLLDIKYQRLGLHAAWEHLHPQAFMHAGHIIELQRKSFRDIYRRVLEQFAGQHGPAFIGVCKKAPAHIPMTTDRDVYHYATTELHGYIFNLQLPADKIRIYIGALYDVLKLPQSQFAVWV